MHPRLAALGATPDFHHGLLICCPSPHCFRVLSRSDRPEYRASTMSTPEKRDHAPRRVRRGFSVLRTRSVLAVVVVSGLSWISVRATAAQAPDARTKENTVRARAF